jgi:hypothetical protein
VANDGSIADSWNSWNRSPVAVSVNSNAGISISDNTDSTCKDCKILRREMGEIVEKLNARIDQLIAINNSKNANNPPIVQETFTDKRLLRIKASEFLTGRTLTSHMCQQLVANLYDNEPPVTFSRDDVKSLNDRRDCRDPCSLSKWCVFEMFSLGDLVGRNCLGVGMIYLEQKNHSMKRKWP